MAAVTDNTRSGLFMILSVAAYTLNDAFMKSLGGNLPLIQAIFLRGLATVAGMVLLAWMLGGLRFRLPRHEWKLIVLRSLAEVGATYFILTALFHMPLANVVTILQMLPLAVTLAGALFLHEVVGWRRCTAIGIGFLGMLLIVRPGAEGFSIYSVHALIAVVLVTVRDLAARQLGREVPSVTVALVAAVSVTVFGGFGLWGQPWQPVGGLPVLLVGGAAVALIGGYLFSVMTIRLGEIVVIAPLRYTAIVWALLLGWLVFGEWPDGITLFGAVIIVATGIYTFDRERRLARQDGCRAR